MMKASISTTDFKKAMAIVQPCVSKDDCRPMLTFISGQAKDNKVILTACDAYRLAEYTIEAFQNDFSAGRFWINPKVRMFFVGPQITIETNDKTTTVTDGHCGYTFRNWEGDVLDTDKLFAEDRGETKHISLGPALLASTIKPLALERRSGVTLAVGDWNEAVLLTTPNDPAYRGMILPMRMGGEWEARP